MHKIRICESEASETAYWLELISELNWIDKVKQMVVLTEASELLAIFTSISKKLKLG